jgi:hypothetical protein
MKVSQEKLDAFLKDYAELVGKHGLSFNGCGDLYCTYPPIQTTDELFSEYGGYKNLEFLISSMKKYYSR